jgi:hypothetical protein
MLLLLLSNLQKKAISSLANPLNRNMINPYTTILASGLARD